jgi:spermidine synthase
MSAVSRRGLLYSAFFLSGITALVYEIVWSRYLTLFVGGTSVAHTIVLATFMAGLAAGNAFFGRRADRPGTKPLRLYALLEVGIGLLCLLFPTVFSWVSSLYVILGSHVGPGAPVNAVLKGLLAALSMFLPCMLIGGTLPVLVRYIVVNLTDLGPRIGFLYFINTAGAVAGSVLGGFWVVEEWGLEFGMVGTSLINITLGAIFYFLAQATEREPKDAPSLPPVEEQSPTEDVYSAGQARTAFFAIGVAGGLSMLYELCWVRLLVLSMGSTVHSFSTMLLSFILGIALGSALVARLLRKPRNAMALFGLCEVGISLVILVPLPWYEALPFVFFRMGSVLVHDAATYPLFLLAQVALGLGVMLLPTVLIGATLPLASRVCVDRIDSVGARVGDVFSANTVGTVVGAILTGFVALPRLGLERTLIGGAIASGLLGVVLLRSWRPAGTDSPFRAVAEVLLGSDTAPAPRLWPAALVALLLASANVALRSNWDPRLLQTGLYRWEGRYAFESWDDYKMNARKRSYLFSKDGADATVSVVESGGGRALLVNGKSDASNVFPDILTQALIGHLPMFLHRDPHTAMVVGLGSGATAGAILLHPGSSVDVAEISPEVVSAAAFFESVNGGILRDPRMSLKVMDGREFLLLSRKRYDVIASEPTNLWVPGVAGLFTRDFYNVVAEHLEKGGVFSQWIQLYGTNASMVTSVARSLSEVFPYVSAWAVDKQDLIFVASRERRSFDPEAFVRRLEEVDPARGVPKTDARVRILRDPVLFLTSQVATVGAVRLWSSKGAIYQDFRPRLEFEAARAQFFGRPYPLFENLDERVVHRTDEPLYLEQFLHRYPIDAAARQRLFEALQSFGGVSQALGDRIALAAALEGDRDLLTRLSPEAAGRLLLVEALAERIDRKGSETALCTAYEQAVGALLPAASSVFAHPSAETWNDRIQVCKGRAGATATHQPKG